MDFQQRFKGKVSTMSKEGVIGMVQKPSQPIDKGMSQSQVVNQQEYQMAYSYPPPSELYNQIQGKRNLQFFYKPDPQQKINESNKSQVYTNIDHNRNGRTPVKAVNQAFRQNAQNIINEDNNPNYNTQTPHRYSLPDQQRVVTIPYKNNNFNGIDMNEYEIIAVRRARSGNSNNTDVQQVKKVRNGNQQDTYPYQYPSQQLSSSFQSQSKQIYESYQDQGTGSEHHHLSPLVKTYSYDPKFLQKNSNQGYQLEGRINLVNAGLGSIKDSTPNKKPTNKMKLY